MARDSDLQPFHSTTVKTGKVVEWNRDKALGFVESDGRRLFLHVKEFARKERRPVVGDQVRFIVGQDPKGRACAQQVTLVNPAARVSVGSLVVLLALLVAPGLALVGVALGLAWEPWLPGAAVLVVSAITYRLYAHDKQQAQTGGWRVPESTLHFAELLGGWPGAFVAQRRLRHKSAKRSYLAAFWGIVALYQVVAVDLLTGGMVAKPAIALAKGWVGSLRGSAE